MHVIAEWSILESFLSSLFVQMLGANPGPAAAIYASLTGSNAQKDSLRAVGETVMSPDEQDVFEALLSLTTAAAKDRARIAHHVWGHSPELPDAVLLGDPKGLMIFNAAVREYTRNLEGEVPVFPRDKILVYRKDDFVALSHRIQRAMGLLSQMRFVLQRGHPCNEGDQQFAQLSAEPEVREFLDRLADRRKRSSGAD